MDIESLIRFFTSKDGVYAAIAAVVALAGSLIGIIRPILKDRRTKQEGIPKLLLSNLKTEDPPPWSEAGKSSFQLMNAQAGKAILADLFLVVKECGSSQEPKLVEAAAPVPQFTYKVRLSPKVAQYDVRKKEFGEPEPHSFEKQEVESFVVELRSTEPQWYVFQLLVKWYDVANPSLVYEIRSPEQRIEFRPRIEDLLSPT